MEWAHKPEKRGVPASCWSHLTVRLLGMAAPKGAGAQGVQPGWLWQLTVHCWGIATPNGTSSQGRGTGISSKPLVAGHGALVGYLSPQWRGLTGGGD